MQAKYLTAMVVQEKQDVRLLFVRLETTEPSSYLLKSFAVQLSV